MALDFVIRNARLPRALQPTDIGIEGGLIAVMEPGFVSDAPEHDAGGRLVCGGLIESHIHLDKAGIIGRCSICAGTLAEAVSETAKAKAAFTEEERHRMDLLLRRLGRELRGALSPRRVNAAHGRIHASRTIRANMRYGGLPFRPVLVAKRDDRPRLLLLVDVSLSVRNTARFTIHLVHSLQSLFSQVRTFAFVSDLVEVTPYLERCDLDEALGMIFGGEVLDVDANSDYGHALATFHAEHLSAVNRRTTVLVLGDGRGNGKPAHVWALDDIRRRARQLVWLTPEPERYWHLGRSDLPAYAELCDRVELVRDLDQLEAAAGRVLRPS